jgi:hypothetical protein
MMGHGVWLSRRFCLSDGEALMAERGGIPTDAAVR